MSWAEIFTDFTKHWPVYLSMPVIAAIIGYVTKLAAIKMMFHPLEFRGRRPYLGWQGVIPQSAGRMAAIACDTLTANLLEPKDLFDRLDPERMVIELQEPLSRAARQIAEEVASRTYPDVWRSLPEAAKQRLLDQVQAEAPRLVTGILNQVREDVEGVFDFKDMVVTYLLQNKRTLNQLFQDAGHRVFRFIVRFGAPSGFALGLGQAVAWGLFKEPLIMPLFGLLTGWITDYVALKLVFVPKFPKRILGVFTWQGLFFKYRDEVTDMYGDLVAKEVITPHNMIEAVLRGPMSDRLFALIQNTLEAEMDRQVGLARPLVVMAVGGTGYRQVKELVADLVLRQIPDTAVQLEQYAADALDIRATVVEKMREMSQDEFEQLLRPAFQQDEWKLIAVGALLGFFVGELQVLIVEYFGR
ncbi:MAG TPA: DUF445 domain-containing protein [Pseudonocardia sp.]